MLPELKSDTRKDLQSFLRAVNTAFGCRCQEHLGQNGLLGFCVTDDQWAVLPGVTAPDAEHPGNFIVANRPTVEFMQPPQLGAAAAVLKQYEISFRRNSAISEALRNLKNTIIASIQDADINELSDPTMELVSATSLEILQHLRARYGIFLPQTLDRSDAHWKRLSAAVPSPRWPPLTDSSTCSSGQQTSTFQKLTNAAT